MKPLVGALASFLTLAVLPATLARGQIAPGAQELAAYQGLHAAAAKADVPEIKRLAGAGADLNVRDGQGRAPVMVAAHNKDMATARALIAAGADLNLLDNQAYDVLTIAAVL